MTAKQDTWQPATKASRQSGAKTKSRKNNTQGHEQCLLDLEYALRKHWNLGQNILLCWCFEGQGVRIMIAPHYFLARYSASLNDCAPADRLEALNGMFIRGLISGKRQLSESDFQGTVQRLQLRSEVIELPKDVDRDALVSSVETLVTRFSMSYVAQRAVLLFDIVNFSLLTPFEQASQLNSLSYSLNSAYNKLLKKNIEIHFSRTTTGDGYYVWNQQISPRADLDLFHFMLLVLADNAVARRHSVDSNTVPELKTGFALGSHYEFYQVEGVNPSGSSYIVGEVTIDLARMMEQAKPGQIYVGDFATRMPTSLREVAYLIEVDTPRFVERASNLMVNLKGIELSGQQIEGVHCYLSGQMDASAGKSVRRFRITDKHGSTRHAYNLRINIYTGGGRPIILGLQDVCQSKSKGKRPRGISTLLWSRPPGSIDAN